MSLEVMQRIDRMGEVDPVDLMHTARRLRRAGIDLELVAGGVATGYHEIGALSPLAQYRALQHELRVEGERVELADDVLARPDGEVLPRALREGGRRLRQGAPGRVCEAFGLLPSGNEAMLGPGGLLTTLRLSGVDYLVVVQCTASERAVRSVRASLGSVKLPARRAIEKALDVVDGSLPALERHEAARVADRRRTARR